MRKVRKSAQGRISLLLFLLLLIFLFSLQGSLLSYAENGVEKEKVSPSVLEEDEAPWDSGDFLYGEIEKKIISKNSYYGITG